MAKIFQIKDYLKKEKIILPKKTFDEYHSLIEEAKTTQSLFKFLFIYFRLKKIIKEARKNNLK